MSLFVGSKIKEFLTSYTSKVHEAELFSTLQRYRNENDPHFDNKNDIRYSSELGGGAMLDCLIYPLSFVFRILGDDIVDYMSSIFYDTNSAELMKGGRKQMNLIIKEEENK